MKRESFKSRLGFLLVSAGCAIGIGNVWKFPYLAGQNGGGFFVLFYLLFLCIMGIPVLTMELSVGRVAEQWAQRLGGGPLAFVHKTRDITRPNQAVANRVVGDVAGKDCVLVDDLIDTAGTIAGACHVLQDAGAKSVTVVATHGVLSGPAVERLKNCGAREVVLTDTVPIPEEKRWDGLTVLSIAPLLASAIRAVFEDGSVAELFDTYPEHHGQGFLFA